MELAFDEPGKSGGTGQDDEHLVSDEEGEEAVMEIEEIEREPKDSAKVKRCSVCRRMVFGHKGLGDTIVTKLSSEVQHVQVKFPGD